MNDSSSADALKPTRPTTPGMDSNTLIPDGRTPSTSITMTLVALKAVNQRFAARLRLDQARVAPTLSD